MSGCGMCSGQQGKISPLFATARITGWSAHRLEELINCGKIIRPAYMSISENKEYVDLKDR